MREILRETDMEAAEGVSDRERTPRVFQAPGLPQQAVVGEHSATHTPYRV